MTINAYMAEVSAAFPPIGPLGAPFSCHSKKMLFGGRECTRYFWTERVLAYTAEDAVIQLRVKFEHPDNDIGGYKWDHSRMLTDFMVDGVRPEGA